MHKTIIKRDASKSFKASLFYYLLFLLGFFLGLYFSGITLGIIVPGVPVTPCGPVGPVGPVGP